MTNGDDRLTVALAADSEASAPRLRTWLTLRPEIGRLAEVGSVAELAETARAGDVHLALLDAALDGGEALELCSTVRDALGSTELVVISTSKEDAVRAYELGAVDFLEVPVRAPRVARAVTRAMARRSPMVAASGDRTARGRRQLDSPVPSNEAADPRLQRMVVRSRGRWIVIPTASIVRVESDRNYLILHREDGDPVRVRQSIEVLERQFDTSRFFRVHRSTIVRLDQVSEIQATDKGDYRVRLLDGVETRVPRARRESFLAALEGPSPLVAEGA